jgi:tetratricopeptide (TPR) repeat protein
MVVLKPEAPAPNPATSRAAIRQPNAARAKPTMVYPAQSAPSAKSKPASVAEAPAAPRKNAVRQEAARPAESQFKFGDVTSNLSRSLALPQADQNLVTRRKTEFVTPSISPATRPNVAAKIPLIVPAPDTAKTAESQRENKLRVADRDEIPTPATTDSSPASEAVAGQRLAPVPVGVAPAPAGSPPAAPQPAAQDLADKSKAADASAAGPADSVAAPEMMPLAKDSGGPNPAAEPYAQLPWGQAPRRSAELLAALKQADNRVLKGYELASRGALYAARAEFIAAVKIVAQAYDNQEGTRRYTKAAAAGLTALKESADFVRHSQSLGEIDLAKTILPHSTPVLKEGDTSQLTPDAAARCYYNYAQEQLSAAVAQEVCGSMALYAMGKVAILAAKSGGTSLSGNGHAMAYYRAALIADPKNFRAANELGVLLAENGQYELARDLLIRSVSVSPQATTWKNLAALHARTGDRNLAEHARQQALAMQRLGRDQSTAPNVQWVDPATFATSTPATDTLPVAVEVPQKEAPDSKTSAPEAKTPPVNVAKKSIGDWLRIGPRRQ